MRRLQPTAAATGLAVALLVGGCAAHGRGAPPHDDPAVTAAAPAPLAPPAPEPPAAPPASFAGLDARIKEATTEAAASGAEIAVALLDRSTGQLLTNGNGRAYPTASVVKLFIADDLLYRESRGEIELSAADRKALDAMLRSSDDGAAQMFWDRSGGNAVIARIKARYGLGGVVAPYNSHWDVTQAPMTDLVRYYDMLLSGAGGLPRDKADIILGDIAAFTPTGADGYPQRFGIPDGLPGEQVAVKQGWFCCWNPGRQLHVSTGIIGADRRYVMAVGSLDPTTAERARADITRFVRTMFPDGRIG